MTKLIAVILTILLGIPLSASADSLADLLSKREAAKYYTRADGTPPTGESSTTTGDWTFGGNTTWDEKEAIFSDGTYTGRIKQYQEPGQTGGRLTIGVDENNRTLVLCDEGDVNKDFNTAVQTQPTLYIATASGSLSAGTKLTWRSLYFGDIGSVSALSGLGFYQMGDRPASNVFSMLMDNAVYQMTDTDGEQNLLFMRGNVEQSGTAGYSGIRLVMYEDSLGNASTNTGGTNNLMVLGTSLDTDMFKIRNDGKVFANIGLRVGDAYDMPVSDGTAGQILVTDGADTVSWASSSSALDTVYAKLDGTNTPTTGDWSFGHDVYGPATGSCTEPTTFTINAGCVHCTEAKCGVEVTANVDITEGGCPGGSLLFVDTANGPLGVACYPGQAFDATFTAPGGSPALDYGVDDIRLCIVHVGEGAGVTALVPSSQTCADAVALFEMPPEVVVADDPDFYAFNATTCSYDFSPDEGITLIDGWDAAEVVSDSEPEKAWTITDAGAATLASATTTSLDVGVAAAIGNGSDAYPRVTENLNQAGLYVHKVYSDTDPDLYSAVTNYYRSGLTFLLEIYPHADSDPGDTIQTAYGVRGVTVTRSSGYHDQILGGLFQSMASGTSTVNSSQGVFSQVGAEEAGATLNDGIFYNTYPVTVGTVKRFRVLNVPDLGAAEDVAVGIEIPAFTSGPTVSHGMRSRHDVFLPALAPTVIYQGTITTGGTPTCIDAAQTWLTRYFWRHHWSQYVQSYNCCDHGEQLGVG